MRLKEEDIPECEYCGSENTYQSPMMTTRPLILCRDCGEKFLYMNDKFIGI